MTTLMITRRACAVHHEPLQRLLSMHLRPNPLTGVRPHVLQHCSSVSTICHTSACDYSHPSLVAIRLMESSLSPCALIRPQMAMVVAAPLMALPVESTSAIWSWIEAWSFAVMSRSKEGFRLRGEGETKTRRTGCGAVPGDLWTVETRSGRCCEYLRR